MTGKELMDWIIEQHAEDLPIAIQYRDGGGDYPGGEILGSMASDGYPCLAHVKMDSAGNVDITYGGLTPNAVIV